jgi:hypothetical protein
MSDNFITVKDLEEDKKKTVFSGVFVPALLVLFLTTAVGTVSYKLGSITSPASLSEDTSTAITPDQGLATRDASEVAGTADDGGNMEGGNYFSPVQENTNHGTPSPTPSVLTGKSVLDAVSELDGYRNSTGTGKKLSEIRSGMGPGFVSRGFVSFAIGSIPPQSSIQSAMLRLYQVRVEGSPFQKGGDLLLDHLSYGTTLDESDYATPAFTYSFAVLSDSAAVEYKEVDVTLQVRDDFRNAKPASQFRLHFETELANEDDDFDFVYFESGENFFGTGYTPELIVEYR